MYPNDFFDYCQWVCVHRSPSPLGSSPTKNVKIYGVHFLTENLRILLLTPFLGGFRLVSGKVQKILGI